MGFRRFILLGACLGLAASAACFSGSGDAGGGSGNGDAPLTARTCKTKGTPAMAPGGYYSNGASVCSADGKAHLFHGVDRPSLEWDPAGEFHNGSGIPASDFQAMASWHANIVRIATNQDFWLSGASAYNPTYSTTIATAVKNAEAAGLDVILDLHWSDCGNLHVFTAQDPSDTTTVSGQQVMADVNSIQFWKEVAAMFKDDGHVFFELYNEPNTVPWQEWLSGGNSVPGCPTVGMQKLYDAVRGTGAKNMVIVGGLSWAFDLSQVTSYPIQGAYNLMYATHPYSTNDSESEWAGSFGYLTAGNIAPVIATEFGSGGTGCTGQWDTDLINFSKTNEMSWTAWAWWANAQPNSTLAEEMAQACNFPQLLLDWSYTPSVSGVAVKAALALEPVPVPILPDAGHEGGVGDAIADGALDAVADAPGSMGDVGTDTAPPEAGAADAGGDTSADGPTSG